MKTLHKVNERIRVRQVALELRPQQPHVALSELEERIRNLLGGCGIGIGIGGGCRGGSRTTVCARSGTLVERVVRVVDDRLAVAFRPELGLRELFTRDCPLRVGRLRAVARVELRASSRLWELRNIKNQEN